jgi:multidrug efflux system membrane fusion protein
VSTQLKLFVEQNALVVPSAAVVTGQSGAYVYVVTDSGTAQQRPIVVERTAGNLSIIASGLKDGETIVTEGQSRLTPNSKVAVSSPSGGPGRGGRGGRGANGGAGAAQAGTKGQPGTAQTGKRGQGGSGRTGQATP